MKEWARWAVVAQSEELEVRTACHVDVDWRERQGMYGVGSGTRFGGNGGAALCIRHHLSVVQTVRLSAAITDFLRMSYWFAGHSRK